MGGAGSGGGEGVCLAFFSEVVYRSVSLIGFGGERSVVGGCNRVSVS